MRLTSLLYVWQLIICSWRDQPSLIVGRDDADHNGKWSWSLYPQAHPNGRHIVFDMYIRNTTHEISLREEDIYPIDGKPIFEKPDFWKRSFPNGWCRNEIRPSRKDGNKISLSIDLVFERHPPALKLFKCGSHDN
jgi:hypothetical protein